MTAYYTVTGNPPDQTRGVSSLVRSEFNLIAAGFTSASGDINARGQINGQVWGGAHDFTGGSIKVPTLSYGSSGNYAVSWDALNAAIFSSANLPAQSGNTGKFFSTDGLTPSWTDTFDIAVNEKKGANIASAATINLTTATGNYVHITGTTGISAITIPVGAERTVITDAAVTFTASAALTLPGGATSLTTAATDRLIIRGDTAGAVVIAHISGTASSSEIKAGTNTAKTVSPAALLAATGFSAYFQSVDQTITTAGALTIAHGLGRSPVLIQAFLKCVTAEAGYGTGEIIPTPIGTQVVGGNTKGVIVVPDATNIFIRFSDGGGSANTFIACNKGTGVNQVLTNANWSFFVRAWA